MNARREILFLFFGVLAFFLPFFLLTQGKMLRLDTDYDSNLPVYRFIVETVRTTGRFPTWNPYVSTGIPIIGDPLLSILNPFFTVPVLIFGVESGMYVVFLLSLLTSAIGMWWMLKFLAISVWFRIFGSLLYAFSGALAARVASGHIEKVLSYPLLPLFFTGLFKHNVFIISLAWTLILFSGDVYALWLTLTIFLIINFYKIRRIILILVLFILFSGIILIPMIADVYPNLARLFPIDPFAGSIHIIFFFLPFLVPLQTSFYDTPILQKLLGFHFNWYEYFAFISPLPFVFLWKLPKIWGKFQVRLLLIILATGAFYISLRHPYSPFYWLFQLIPQVDIFRVPQRMFMVVTPVMIALIMLCAEKWSRRFSYVLLALAVAWTFVVTLPIWVRSFEQKREYAESVIRDLRSRDPSEYYVASFVCCMQWYLVGEHIPIINYYYGWKPKSAPSFINENGDGYDFSALNTVRPKYILGSTGADFSSYSYDKYFEKKSITIWKSRL